jgi:hypothetical protein
LNVITPKDIYQFVASITPIVKQTGLSENEKTQLYADVLRVIKTAPTYSPR